MVDPRPGRGAWSRTTWLLFLLVVATAVSTLFKVRDPDLPGTLRLGMINPGASAPSLGLSPLADYLGQELHRRVVIETCSREDLARAPVEFDLALVPLHGDLASEDVEVLAWAKPVGRSTWRVSAGILRARDTPWPPRPGLRLIFGDGLTWGGSRGALEALRRWSWRESALDSCARGADPYHQQGAIAALVHGAFDYAVVRESEVQSAIRIGRLPRDGYVYTRVDEPRGEFALIAGHSLSDAARRRIREAALNLDHYRQDPSRLRAQAASLALRSLGFSGFAPGEVLPSLRP